MSCGTQAPADGLQPERRAALKAGFNRMWPASAPFPPAMPWLAAVVNRGEAWAWVASLARQDGSVRLDSPSLALNFVGRAMNGRSVYASKRKESKRERQAREGVELHLDEAVEDMPEIRPDEPSNPYEGCDLYTCSGCGSSQCCRNICDGVPGPCTPCALV